MNIYYMRDNHTFLRLPLDADEAIDMMKAEFEKGYSYGMLCTKDHPVEPLHARGPQFSEIFFAEARQWINNQQTEGEI